MSTQRVRCFSFVAFLLSTGGIATMAAAQATEQTKAVNAAVLRQLPFSDKQDFEDAQRGFIAPLLDGGIVKNDKGQVVHDARQGVIPLDAPAPDSVNPSFWRQSQLNGISGLFKVVDGIYQVRGNDIANMTFIETKRGVVIMDTLGSVESARTALALYAQHRPNRPVMGIIYTHSHIDHFGGAGGVISEADAKSGKVKVIAPEGFTKEAVSENVFAGNAMMRRATYSYGMLLPQGAKGSLGSGLGPQGSTGTTTLILPNIIVSKTGQKETVDGLTFEFLMAPHTEAPAEMHLYIPQYKALSTAENACHTLHNFYTLRGAKTRDVSEWVGYLNETLDKWGDKAEVLFAPHSWPTWGNQRINDHIALYRDTFRYIHDQALHLANQGYTMDEIGELVQLPPALARNWSSRGYYGSVSHNARAVYNFYLGYFDGNPADLHQHMPVDRARRYVKALGGANNVIQLARAAYNEGDYTWAAELLKHVVYNDPNNKTARTLQADVFEQLGYQAESGTWRGFYLSGAQELRNGVKKGPAVEMTPEMVAAMPAEMMLDYLAIRLDGPRAANANIAINVNLTDTKERLAVTVKNGVLNYRKLPGAKPDLSINLTKAQFGELLTGRGDLAQLAKNGKVKVEGNAGKLSELLALADNFDFWFNIVTPNGQPAAATGRVTAEMPPVPGKRTQSRTAEREPARR